MLNRRRVLVTLLVGWVVLGAGVVFLPIGDHIGRALAWLAHTGHGLGLPPSVDLYSYDFVLNVVLFAVPVMLLAAAWPGVRRSHWVVLGVVVSFCVEQLQGAFLPRTSSLLDWVANSLGALVGVLVVVLLERRRPAPAQSH